MRKKDGVFRCFFSRHYTLDRGQINLKMKLFFMWRFCCYLL